jgi:fatty-acyl-CoA synthase
LGARFRLAPAGIAGIRRWIESLAATHATFTAAPDFAYRLALRLTPPEASFDLGPLRYALNAAEPVRASTITAFEERFGLQRVVQPGYGLAEATVGVTARAPGAPLLVDAQGAVALGQGFPRVELGVRDDRGTTAARGAVGEVVVKSPALADGYLDDPAASADTWGADGWLRTGDLGYLGDEGELYVVGRRKDVLSVGGQTIAPRELEELVDQLDGVRRTAAVGLPGPRGEGELIALFVEGAGSHRGREEELVRVVNRTVREHLGFAPGRVTVLRPGSIPHTANAKIQRQELVHLHSSGELRQRGLVVWP